MYLFLVSLFPSLLTACLKHFFLSFFLPVLPVLPLYLCSSDSTFSVPRFFYSLSLFSVSLLFCVSIVLSLYYSVSLCISFLFPFFWVTLLFCLFLSSFSHFLSDFFLSFTFLLSHSCSASFCLPSLFFFSSVSLLFCLSFLLAHSLLFYMWSFSPSLFSWPVSLWLPLVLCLSMCSFSPSLFSCPVSLWLTLVLCLLYLLFLIDPLSLARLAVQREKKALG